MFNELILQAKRSTDPEELKNLSKSMSSLVRRVVAKNVATSHEVLEILSYDPVKNVSYEAVNNPNNSSESRSLQTLHPCIKCQKDEHNLNCKNCYELACYNESTKPSASSIWQFS